MILAWIFIQTAMFQYATEQLVEIVPRRNLASKINVEGGAYFFLHLKNVQPKEKSLRAPNFLAYLRELANDGNVIVKSLKRYCLCPVKGTSRQLTQRAGGSNHHSHVF